MAEAALDAAGSIGLKADLSLFDSITIVAGSMIGSGIFIVSADIARHVSSPAALLAVWIVGGLMTIAGALAYGELAAMMPQAGGQYVYLREAYGGMPAFLFGWTLLLVIQTGTIAAVAVAFARFGAVLWPVLGGPMWFGWQARWGFRASAWRDRGDRDPHGRESARARHWTSRAECFHQREGAVAGVDNPAGMHRRAKP